MSTQTIVLGIAESLIASLILLYFIKLTSYLLIKGFLGTYYDISPKNVFNKNVKYEIKLSPLNFIAPVLVMTLKVKRRGLAQDNADWDGLYHSDVLNPFYFKGIYILKFPPEKDTLRISDTREGYHEIHLINKSPKKMAFSAHFIGDDAKWVEYGFQIQK